MHEFIVGPNWSGKTPIEFIKDEMVANTTFPVPGVTTGANKLDPAALAVQVVEVINSALERADRANEICDQATGPDALNYSAGPAAHRSGA